MALCLYCRKDSGVPSQVCDPCRKAFMAAIPHVPRKVVSTKDRSFWNSLCEKDDEIAYYGDKQRQFREKWNSHRGRF